MKKLETKYRNDELSPAELQELRNRIKSMSDYEIGEEMYQTWMNEKIDVTSVPDKQIDKIKAQIENSIKEEKSNGFDFSRIIQIAATILLPVFIILSGYLYYENRQVTDLPLTERKELLQKAVISENGRFAVSRFIEKNGIQFYALAEQQELEGIVAKRKDSKYYFDKRTKDWIKIKYLQDDDFVVLGYVPKENSMNSIILGQYSNGQLVYKGHVTLGVGGEPFRRIKTLNKTDCPFSEIPKGNENAVWVTPELVCTVKYMMKTESGGMRQPVFKGLREDKSPEECIDNIT